MKVAVRKLLTAIVALAVIGAIVFAFLPQPVPVDMATVGRGLLHVTVDEDGKTRIKERYIVSAPLAGRLLRITLEPGDAIERGRTLLARIEPCDPALLDARALAEAEAKVHAAEATLNRAQPALNRAQLEVDHAKSEFVRIEKLSRSNTVSQQEYEDAEVYFRTRGEEYRSAKFDEEIARFELEMAKAALLRTRPADMSTSESSNGESSRGDDRVFEIRSPIHGRVLRLIRESATVVSAGTDLLEVGDPADLEVEIDVLSRDAFRIKPGQKVVLEQWGGDEALEGVVRLVEPAGFTKVSALGVEEQRVNVIVDFADPPTALPLLGDSYRVEGRIVVWEGDNVVKVPTSALFRFKEQWAVFIVDERNRAKLRPIDIGHRSGLEAEVIEGLAESDIVIMHPSDKIADGVAVLAR